MLNEIENSVPFIGREKETLLFENMLDQINSGHRGEKWILNVYGPGGIGKTQLMLRYINICQERRKRHDELVFTRNLVDFYSTAHKRELGILKTIAEQTELNRFKSFISALESYQTLFDQPDPDPLQVSERTDQARQAFLDVCESIGNQPIVLFFDTAEQATEIVLDVLSDLFLSIRDRHLQILVVLAGRESLSFPKISPKWIERVELSGFAPEEIENYFHRRTIKSIPSVTAKIAELSGGRPVLVALTADWIRDGNDPEELVAFPSDRFERAIVERVQKLHFPENRAVMAMGYFYRRFDEKILACILDLPDEKAAQLIEELRRFTFVKYRLSLNGKRASCLLHDEMRELVSNYVWSVWDPMQATRHEWTPKVVDYYEKLIKAEPDRLARHDLCQERLFYWLRGDITVAFKYYLDLAEKAVDSYDADFLEGLNSEIVKFDKRLDVTNKCSLQFYQALSYHWHEQVQEAIRLLEQLINNAETPSSIQAAARAHLVEFYADSGDVDQAIKTGLNGEQWFDSWLAKIHPGNTFYLSIQRDFGILCNNLGYAFRKQSNLDQTIAYYEKALEHFGLSGGAYVQRARTENNLGFALHSLRRDDEAIARVESALALRRHLRAPYELGLSYNVRGIIYLDQWRLDEAKRDFDDARKAFKNASSERGQALVDLAHGRMLRQSGFYKDHLEGQVNPDREEYQQSAMILDRAIDVFLRLKDVSNLSEAYNEMGTLYRHRHNWSQALDNFNQGAHYASKTGNRYREADNLQDIGIVYDQSGDLDKALFYTQQAIQMAEAIGAKYLLARAYRTLANIQMKRGQYTEAFVAAGTALTYFVMLDPEKSKREVFYDEWMIWINGLVLGLPSQAKVSEITEYLIRCWEQPDLVGRRPVDVYPGFVDRMRSLARDFEFLTKKEDE